MRFFLFIVMLISIISCGNSNVDISFEDYEKNAIAVDPRKLTLGKYEKNIPLLLEGKVVHAKDNYIRLDIVFETDKYTDITLKFQNKPDLVSGDKVIIYARYEDNFNLWDWINTNTTGPLYSVDFYSGPFGSGNFPKVIDSKSTKK